MENIINEINREPNKNEENNNEVEGMYTDILNTQKEFNIHPSNHASINNINANIDSKDDVISQSFKAYQNENEAEVPLAVEELDIINNDSNNYFEKIDTLLNQENLNTNAFENNIVEYPSTNNNIYINNEMEANEQDQNNIIEANNFIGTNGVFDETNLVDNNTIENNNNVIDDNNLILFV